MSNTEVIEIPDIGDFNEVQVIEILVNPGDEIQKEDSLVTLESDKASMEIPSPLHGVVARILVKIGDKVSKGTPLVELTVSEAQQELTDSKPSRETMVKESNEDQVKTVETTFQGHVSEEIEAEVVVLGSGPGGYTAAFRAADLGLKVVLIERYENIGGVCLNVGCIPSKTLLHMAQILNESKEMVNYGIDFQEPQIDLKKIREFKKSVVGKLTGGLAQLAKQRKVSVVRGEGHIESAHSVVVKSDNQTVRIRFEKLIIAAGSRVVKPSFIPWEDPRVMDSTDALDLQDIPARLLVIGGGIIGLEMATVYNALGSEVTIVELAENLIPGADSDLIRPLEKGLRQRYKDIFLKTKVSSINAKKKGLECLFEGEKAPEKAMFDRVLVAVGRVPNGQFIGAEAAGIQLDEKGFISVDSQMRTNIPHIFAIGDIVGQPMLAHKATHEGKVAAEVCAGLKTHFDARVIPSVAYTDPEIAWVGLTETEAKRNAIEYQKGVFPWAASGRSLSLGRSEGMTKLLFEPGTKRILGGGIVGPNAGELIAELALAIEMNAESEDISLTIHPHPTLSETICFAAEAHDGTITDLYIPTKAKANK